MNYQKIYDSLIERAKNRVPEGFVERHHIIPKCMGGADTNENLVALYPEEHFVAHVLLVKICPDHHGLIFAVSMMCSGHTGKRVRRKLYGWLKRKHAAYMRESQRGEGNSQYGTMWICDGTDSKKISKDATIPNGWVAGRTIRVRHCETCGEVLPHKSQAKYCKLHKPKPVPPVKRGDKLSEETKLKISLGMKKRTDS